MPDLPTGTVTLLFTDIEGSSDLWRNHGTSFMAVLDHHNRLMREAAKRWSGYEVKTEGDAFFLAFSRATDAVQFAVQAQLSFAGCDWSSVLPGVDSLRVRMGMHTGEPLVATHPDGTPDYFGPVVNIAARVGAAGHGGQVILSGSAYELCRILEEEALGFLDLGEHRLKGVGAEHLWQLSHPDLRSEFPPLKTLSIARHNLPLPPNSFVGRDQEIEHIRHLLEGARLLTLTGPGGTGKTRLSQRVAEELIDEFKDGVWLVELAALTDPALVPQEIARTLRLRDEPGKTITQTLVEHLKSKEMLLLLDNFEQVTGAGTLVATILSGCPGVKVLVTSRSVLHLRAEQEFAVAPLAVPPVGAGASHDVIQLSQYAAVELFLQRAMAAKPDFSITNENAPAVAEICYRLDGLPLAIELAAARVKVLPPRAMLERLESRLKLLTGGARDLPERQQTLRAAIDWSHDLLAQEERVLFRRLAVFSGGWSLEAAEAICGNVPPSSVPGSSLLCQEDVLDRLSSVVDRSLVRQEEAEGNLRFMMLQTIREYALEQLRSSGEETIVREGHLRYYLQLAEEAQPQMSGPEQARWLDRLEQEHDNLRTALDGAVCQPLLTREPEAALRLAGALGRFWVVRGYFAEGRLQTARALKAVPERRASAAGAKVLHVAGVMASNQGDHPAARALDQECLTIQRELGDRRGIAHSLHNLGCLASEQGDYPAARALFEESLTNFRELGDRRGIAHSLNSLGIVACDQADYPAARALHEESLASFRELGDRSRIAYSLINLGSVARDQGDDPAARALCEESLNIQRELGDRSGIAYSLHNLGIVAYRQGDYPAARGLYEESLASFRELGERSCVAESLEELGELAVSQEDFPRAARLLGAAGRMREELGTPLTPTDRESHDRTLKKIQDVLGDTTAAFQAEGQAMTLEQAVEYALADSKPEV